MASITKSAGRAGRPAFDASKIPDAVKLLKEDHREVEALFEKFETARTAQQRQTIANRICLMLTMHAQIEEELLYPQAHDNVEDEDLVYEAEIEHASAKQLIAEIRSSSPSDPSYAARVTVLGEYVKHHVKEEEREMFPQLKSSDMDLKELGLRLYQRKQELMQAMKPV